MLKRSDWTDMYMPADQFVVFLNAEQIRVGKLMDSPGLAPKWFLKTLALHVA